MTLLGNVVWFFLGGWFIFLLYAIGAIIFFPMMIPLFRLAVYSAWPFGKDVVTKDQLSAYRTLKNGKIDSNALETTLQVSSGFLNILWMLTFGWLLALLHLFFSLVNLSFFFLIITIPNIGGHWKLIRVAFMPFNKVIVRKEIANEIVLGLEKNKLKI